MKKETDKKLLTDRDAKMTAKDSVILGCPSALTRLSMIKTPRLFNDMHLWDRRQLRSVIQIRLIRKAQLALEGKV